MLAYLLLLLFGMKAFFSQFCIYSTTLLFLLLVGCAGDGAKFSHISVDELVADQATEVKVVSESDDATDNEFEIDVPIDDVLSVESAPSDVAAVIDDTIVVVDSTGVVTSTGTRVQTYYRDADADGYGSPAETMRGPTMPLGYSLMNTDCDDTDPFVNPDATESNGDAIDQDCNGHVNVWAGGATSGGTGPITTCAAGVTPQTFYRDADTDGYGSSRLTVSACVLPTGYAVLNTDCNDNRPDVHPGATELNGDGVDQDCDGQLNNHSGTIVCASGSVPQTYYKDADDDSYGSAHSTAPTVSACELPVGYSATNIDCNDRVAGINPGQSGADYGYLVYQEDPATVDTTDTTHTTSVTTTGYLHVDNDCDGATDEDGKMDGNAADIIPGYIAGKGVFYNVCDGHGAMTFYTDADGDGHGDEDIGNSIYACTNAQPVATSKIHDDCDDSVASTNPEAAADYSNVMGVTHAIRNVDADCDGRMDEDGAVEVSAWDATVAWNGMMVKNNAGNSNEHIKIGSYVSNIDVTNAATGAVTYDMTTAYWNGTGDDQPYDYASYHTAMRANMTYMQFYENYFEFDSNTEKATLQSAGGQPINIDCESDNKCTGQFTIDLTNADSRGDALAQAFIQDKNATVFLRGYVYDHASRMEFSDNSVSMWIEDNSSAILSNSTSVTVNFKINFNGQTSPSHIKGSVFFTIAVYDSDYVKVGSFESAGSGDASVHAQDSSDSSTFMKKYAELTLSEQPASLSDRDEVKCYSDGCEGQNLPLGIVVNAWGFNSNASYDLYQLSAVARPLHFFRQRGLYMAAYEGWVHNADPSGGLAGTGDVASLPDLLEARVISCSNTNVCEMVYKEVSDTFKQESVTKSASEF